MRVIAGVACALMLVAGGGRGLAEVVISSSNAPDRTKSTAKMAEDDAAQAATGAVAELRPRPRETPDYDRAWLASLPSARDDASGDAELQCLSEALYFEARGEDVRGLVAVAEVILNRRDSAAFPDTVCGVVDQGTGERYRCQFTYNCDGEAESIGNQAAYRRVGKIARLMLDGGPRLLTGGATYYHTTAVTPRWSRIFAHTSTIGTHRFYRGGG